MYLIAFWRVTGAWQGQYASSWRRERPWFLRGQGTESLPRHDRAEQVSHWREQGFPDRETGEDTSPPETSHRYLTWASILSLPFQLSISRLHCLLLWAVWLARLSRSLKPGAGAGTGTGPSGSRRKPSCLCTTLFPVAKSKGVREKDNRPVGQLVRPG